MYQPQIGDIVEWAVEPPINGVVTNVHEDDDGDVMVDLDFVDHKPVGVSVDEIKLISTADQRFAAYEEKLLQRLREYPVVSKTNESNQVNSVIDVTTAWNELQDLLADLRDKAKNNSMEGSQDERDAWTGMSNELNRALRMNVRVFSIHNEMVKKP